MSLPECDEQEYPYSMGTTAAVKALSAAITDGNTDILLLNGATILRNQMDGKKTPRQIYKEGLSELEKVENELVDTCNNSNIPNPYIIWYLAPYERIVPDYAQRPMTETRKDLNLARMLLRGTFRRKREVVRDRTKIRYYVLNVGVEPSYQLASIVRGLNTLNRIVMLTHFVIDLHLYEIFPKLRLAECFTGRLIEPDFFGEKVFKNDVVPFIRCTHYVLGDKDLIKPAATPSEKKAIIEVATKENWRMRSSSYVKKSLNKQFKHVVNKGIGK